MTWTPEHRRRYAPAIDHMVRTNAIARLAATVDAIDPSGATGRPRLWSTLVMVQALWWLCRAGAAWKLLPAIYPPRQTIDGQETLDPILKGTRAAGARRRQPS
jgi:hypothetical protein